MKKILVLIVVLAVFVMLSAVTGCTENARAKHWGGKMTQVVPAGMKYLHASWKSDGSLWYAYRPMRAGEVPESVTMKEASTFGVMQGEVTFIESAK